MPTCLHCAHAVQRCPRSLCAKTVSSIRSAKEHFDDPQIIKTYSKEFLQAHRSSIPDMYLEGQGEYFDTLRENVLQADRGTLGAQQALQKTAKQWRRTTRRMGRNSQIEQWAFLRSQYPPNAISHLR